MSWKNLASRSRELRGGHLIANCNCTRRNGLQYDCQRSECQGHPICLTRPFPKCCPALFANRFEMISMGKRTNPSGARKIRVLNNGSKYIDRLIISWRERKKKSIHICAIRLCHSIQSRNWRPSRKSSKPVWTTESSMRTLLEMKLTTIQL